MRLSGFISTDAYGFATVDDYTFADFMYDMAEKYGIAGEHNRGLGGKMAAIKNCKVVMYFSKKAMCFEVAQRKFLDNMFCDEGFFDMETNWVGYSEWTITDYTLDSCHLGGHDLDGILRHHCGEYVNIEVECL